MRRLAACLVLALASCQSAQPVSQPASTGAAVAEKARQEERRLRRAGLEPLALLTTKGLEVQRVDPMWGLLDYPSVELVRDKSGAVVLHFRYWGHQQQHAVSTSDWDRLASMAPRAFAAPDPKQYRRALRKVGVCHTWHVVETNLDGRQLKERVSYCLGDLQKPGTDYADALARLAIESVPMCVQERSESSVERALSKCAARFGPPTAEHRLLVEQG